MQRVRPTTLWIKLLANYLSANASGTDLFLVKTRCQINPAFKVLLANAAFPQLSVHLQILNTSQIHGIHKLNPLLNGLSLRAEHSQLRLLN